VLQEGEYAVETVAAGGEDAATGMLPGGGFVVLDTAVTPDLEAEGVARDLVRAVQQARREAGLDVSDRIALSVVAAPAAADAARTHAGLIARETLATSFDVSEGDVEAPVIQLERA
jgi:isoleucyl-tRNA synthetase